MKILTKRSGPISGFVGSSVSSKHRKHIKYTDSDEDYNTDNESLDERQICGRLVYKNSVKAAINKFSLNGVNGGTESISHMPVGFTHDGVSHIFNKHDFSYLNMKPDHWTRPIWINPENGIIVLESFSPLADSVQDFLATIAEPISRPTFLHEYKLTPRSLYAAVSVGLDPNDIISVLNRFSKIQAPPKIVSFIKNCTGAYGKIKLVLKENRYFVESPDQKMLQMLLQDPVIGPVRVQTEGSAEVITADAPKIDALAIPGTKAAAGTAQLGSDSTTGLCAPRVGPADDDIFMFITGLGDNETDDDDDDVTAVHSFEILPGNVEKIQKQCLDLGYPVLEEYDFRNDHKNANLNIDLRPQAQIRSYQEKSLSKMFGNGRAKSGIIVLPCGAGKTLV